MEPKGVICSTISYPVAKRLDDVSKKTGQTKASLIEAALKDLFTKLEKA